MKIHIPRSCAAHAPRLASPRAPRHAPIFPRIFPSHHARLSAVARARTSPRDRTHSRTRIHAIRDFSSASHRARARRRASSTYLPRALHRASADARLASRRVACIPSRSVDAAPKARRPRRPRRQQHASHATPSSSDQTDFDFECLRIVTRSVRREYVLRRRRRRRPNVRTTRSRRSG